MEALMLDFLEKRKIKKLADLDDFIWGLSNPDFRSSLGDAIDIYIIFRYLWEDPEEFSENLRELMEDMFEEFNTQEQQRIEEDFLKQKKLTGSEEDQRVKAFKQKKALKTKEFADRQDFLEKVIF
mmetsp:Transcript_36887/g.33134  ORF Transcript_36887/g.33134 Transcript_36887/m.33134 type:complete len:125 (+) Transcript_36887:255-629(+)